MCLAQTKLTLSVNKQYALLFTVKAELCVLSFAFIIMVAEAFLLRISIVATENQHSAQLQGKLS